MPQWINIFFSIGVFDFNIEDDDTINAVALAGDGDPVGVVGN